MLVVVRSVFVMVEHWIKPMVVGVGVGRERAKDQILPSFHFFFFPYVSSCMSALLRSHTLAHSLCDRIPSLELKPLFPLSHM